MNYYDSTHAESWRNLAVLYRRQHRLREAIAAAKAGCLYCPHDADLLLLHGALLHEGGDALNAETCLLQVLESDSGDPSMRQRRLSARQHLIALYRDLGRRREADAHHRALAIEAPDLAYRFDAARSGSPRPHVNGQPRVGLAPGVSND